MIKIEKVSAGDDFSAVQLVCIVHATPPATVSWSKDGTTITANSHFKITKKDNSHSLTIFNLTSEDYGDYTCFAQNSVAKNEKTINLSGVPIVKKLKIEHMVSHRKNELKFTGIIESTLPISEHVLEYKRRAVS